MKQEASGYGWRGRRAVLNLGIFLVNIFFKCIAHSPPCSCHLTRKEAEGLPEMEVYGILKIKACLWDTTFLFMPVS